MKKRAIAFLLALCLAFGLCACGGGPKEAEETRTVVDSCGRQVELPLTVDEIAASGSYAQMILYTLCPEKLMGLSSAFTKKQKAYIDEAYWDLPVFGQFYGGGSTINYEAILAATPDVIIDMGEAKATVAADMDSIQKTTGIPTVFIQADLDHMDEAYTLLGQVTGDEERAGELADYIRAALDEAASLVDTIPQEERKRVLYTQGEYGTEVNAAGSVHAQVVDLAGGVNVAELDSFADSGGTEVPMEQIMLWDPEVVILAPESCYDEIFTDPAWAGVQAVQSGQVYEAPLGPYNWMDRPPSVQRVLAVKWLGNLLYPDVFQYDMIAETTEFYHLFFHYDLTEEEARALLAHSTLRED